MKSLFHLIFLAFAISSVFGSQASAPNNVNASIITYLGDGSAGGINSGLGTDVDSDGNVYVVGSGPFNFGLSPHGNISSDGYVLKLSGTNFKPSMMYRFGSQIVAIRTRKTGSGTRIMIRSDVGIAVLDSHFKLQYVIEEDCSVSDCVADLARDGTLAVLRRTSHRIEVFTGGRKTASKDLTGNKHYTDIAVDPIHKSIIYAYFFQSRPHNIPVQVPCILALTYHLDKEVWHDYCVGAEEDYQTHNMADSRPNHLYFSDLDNRLHLAGYTDGGNSIFRYNPLDISRNSGSLHGLKTLSNEVKPHVDMYADTYGMHGATSVSFLATINTSDGSVERATFAITRLSNHQGNSLQTVAVAAAGGGMTVAAQDAMASIENRDTQTVNGQHTAAYGGTDAVLMVLSPHMSQRLVWHQFQKTAGHSHAVAVAANVFRGASRVAFLAKSKDSEFVQDHVLAGTGHAHSTSKDQYVLVAMDLKSPNSVDIIG